MDEEKELQGATEAQISAVNILAAWTACTEEEKFVFGAFENFESWMERTAHRLVESASKNDDAE